MVAVGYFIYQNYKKIVAENRKRTFSKPPEYNQPPNPVDHAPQSKPIPTIERRPALKKIYARPSSVPLKQIKTKANKKEVADLNIEIVPGSETEAVKKYFREINEKIPTQKIITKKYSWITPLNKNELQRAFILGQILNEPSFTKY